MAVLKVTKRSEIGTHQVRRLREKGQIPGILYGHGRKAQPITLSAHEVDVAILHGERLLELHLEGKKENALFKEVQYDTFGQEILHVDLARVKLDERVEVTVPIVLRGVPAGTAEDGVLHQVSSNVSIECLVRAIPEEIRVMVNEMRVGDSLHMRDLPLPEGAKLLSDPEVLVCSVTLVAEEVEAPVEAEAVPEPQVIGEKPEEEKGEERPGENT